MPRPTTLTAALLISFASVATPAMADEGQPPHSDTPTVVAELTDEYNLTVANPDGTYTLTSSREAQRVERDGTWVDIDTTIRPDATGRLSTTATMAEMSFSPGGDAPLAITRVGDRTITLSLPFTLPRPRIHQDTLTYRDVLPDVDLVVHATAEAFTEVLVVKTAEAAEQPELATIALDITTQGLTLDTNPDGSSTALDTGGQPVFFSAPPTMWDSTPDETGNIPDALTPGNTLSPIGSAIGEAPVGRHGTVPQHPSVTLEPDHHALTGPQVTYPVYIDPSFSAARVNFTVVRSNAATYANNTDTLRVGYCGWSDCAIKYAARSYFNFSTSTLGHRSGHKATIHSASVAMTQTHNGSAAASPIQLHRSGTFTTTTPWPGPIGAHLQTLSAAGTAQLNFADTNVKTYLQDIANAGTAHVAFALRAPNESDKYQWKKLANNPTLTVRYSFPVSNPTGLGITQGSITCGTTTYATAKRPQFKASATDYNPTPGSVYIVHRLYQNGVQIGSHGLTQGPSGTAQTWTPTFDLTDGIWTYTTSAQHVASDGTWQYSPGTASMTFQHDSTPPQAPTIHSSTHPDNANGLAWGATQADGGRISISSSEPTIAGYSYSWASSAVPANSDTNCLTNQDIGSTSGYTRATTGQATLNIPTHLTAGPQSLWVKAIDEAGNQSNTVTRYQFHITPNANTVLRYEAESLSPTGTAPRATQNDAVYSNGSRLRAEATIPGQTLTLTFDVPTPGNWTIQPDMTKAADNGIIQFAVNDTPIGTVGYDENLNPITTPTKHDQYHQASQSHSIPIDPITLNAGSNTITITTTGMNAASTGLGFTIDQLRIIKQ